MGVLGEFFSSPYTHPSEPRPDGALEADASIDAWEGDQPFSAELSTADDYTADSASTDLVRDESLADPVHELREHLRSRPWFRIVCDTKLMVDEALDAWSERSRRFASALGFGRKTKGDRCQGCEEILVTLRALAEGPAVHRSLRPMLWEPEADFSCLVEPAGHSSPQGAWGAPRQTPGAKIPLVLIPRPQPPSNQPTPKSPTRAPSSDQDLSRTLSRFAASLARHRTR